MKKIILCLTLLSASHMNASINCMDNSEHLAENIDNKEWHPIACDCPCATVKGNKCIDCGHLQNVSTYVVVQPTKVVQEQKLYSPKNPCSVMKKITAYYL